MDDDWLIHHELEKQAYWRPDEVAIVFEDVEYTYKQLNTRVNKLSRYLRERGISEGDSVSIHGNNRMDWYTIFYACSKTGAVFSTISPRFAPTNIQYITNELEPEVVFHTGDADILDTSLPVIKSHCLDTTEFVDIDATLEDRMADWNGTNPAWKDDRSSSTLHNIFWTSGTTGKPKGVMRDHRSALRGSDVLLNVVPFDETNRRLTASDMMFIAPYCNWGLATLRTGGVNIILKEFSPENIYKQINEKGANIMSLPFSQSKILKEYLDENGTEIEVDIIHTPIPSKEHARILDELSRETYNIYGTTELEVPLVKKVTPPFGNKLSLGKPGVSTDIRLVPKNKSLEDVVDSPPEPGDEGEIVCKGAITMNSYVEETHNRESVQDGWIFTGDMARVTDESELIFIGRVDERIRSGGINIYPSEVEDVLESHPDVQTSVVVGVDDEKWGERTCALVVPVNGNDDHDTFEDELDEYCENHDALSRIKRPKGYEFVQSSKEIPTKNLEKIDRQAIRQEYFNSENR